MSSYVFLWTEFPDPSYVSLGNLIREIQAPASGISTQLDLDQTVLGSNAAGEAVAIIVFKGVLTEDEAYALSYVVKHHDNVDKPGSTPVSISNAVTLSSAHTDVEGLPYARPKASGYGYILNDRDVLVCTATLPEDASPGGQAKKAFEDLYVEAPYPPDLTWGKREDWGEVSVVGVFRSNNPADPYGEHSGLMLCQTQEDAAQHAICTIYQYQAKFQGQPIAYEISGGALYVDAMRVGLGDTIKDKKAHQIYAVAAPNVPGGRSRFFDGYLMAWEQAWMVAQSTDAMRIDPSMGTEFGLPFGEASKLWVYIFYPPGKPVVHHVLRLKTYRYQGTAL